MIVTLLGVRGSTPESDESFRRVGGHTSCVAVEAHDGRFLVLDAGTGFRKLAGLLGDRPLRGTILLTHLHWDHVIGLPFLRNADHPEAEVDLYLPHQGSGDATQILSQLMSPPGFPIGPEELRGTWARRTIRPGTYVLEGFEVTAAPVHHKGGTTFGYRIDDGSATIAYIPDHAPHMATSDELDEALRLASGVDTLLHDAQYLDSERVVADAFSHATRGDVAEFADRAGVSELVLIHHAPGRTDEQLDAAEVTATPQGRRIVLGRENDRLAVGPGTSPADVEVGQSTTRGTPS